MTTIKRILAVIIPVLKGIGGILAYIGQAVMRHLGAVMLGVSVALLLVILFWEPPRSREIEVVQQNGMTCMGLRGNPHSWTCHWDRSPGK